jgi:hypothetical protein
MEGGRLTPEQITKVLRRAAELDAGQDDDDRLDVASVEAAALEAGLSSASVCQALAELRVGALEPGLAPRHRLLEPPTLAVQRVVPGPRPAVERSLGTWLSSQLFEQQRHLGDRAVWVRREGLVAGVRRGLDLNHRLALNGVRRLELALAEPPAQDGGVLVRLHVDVGEQRSAHAWCTGGGAAVGAGLLAGSALVPGLDLLVAAALPVGAGAAVAGHRLGRSYYRREVGKVETALAGLLDRLEHRPASAGTLLGR